jgi:cytochrome P450
VTEQPLAMLERYRSGHESAFALLRSGSQPDDFDPYPLYHSGRHQCLGRLLAVLEASTLLRTLLPRWKSISVAEGGYRWLNNSSFRGLSRLDLAFELDGTAP